MDIIHKTDPRTGRSRPQEKDFDAERRVVRVVPKNDDLRRYLKHPKRGKLNAEGSTEWPNDQFTRRRIKEGDVTIEKKAEAEAEAKAEGEAKVVESSGAKSAAPRTDKPAPASETSSTTDPNKTTAPKTQ